MSKEKKLVLDVNEKPTLGKWVIMAFQHVFAMFGATVLVPVLVNSGIEAIGFQGTALSVSVTLISAGLGTLIYILCTKAKSPVFLGSSFVFITPMIAAYTTGATYGNRYDGISAIMTSLMAVGIIYLIVSIIIKFIGKSWIDKLLPPIVVGPVIMIIGLSLSSSAVNSIGISKDITNIDLKNVLVAFITFITTALIMIRGKGIIKVIPFLLGIMAGYVSALALGMVDFSSVVSSPWIVVPEFMLPYISYTPNFKVALSMTPLALVSIAEHIGDHVVLSNIIDKDLLKNPGLDRTLMGDGLATFVSALIGGPANTTYGENTSVVGMTKVASVYVIGLAAIITILFGFLGKVTAIIQTIPSAVLGGVSLLLYGFISINGLKVLIHNKVDFTKNRNIVIASTMFVLGLGGAAINLFLGGNMVITLSEMSLAAIVGIILNLILPKEMDN